MDAERINLIGTTLEDLAQRTAVVQDAGHMLHHDQPGQVAQLIEAFLATD